MTAEQLIEAHLRRLEKRAELARHDRAARAHREAEGLALASLRIADAAIAKLTAGRRAAA